GDVFNRQPARARCARIDGNVLDAGDGSVAAGILIRLEACGDTRSARGRDVVGHKVEEARSDVAFGDGDAAGGDCAVADLVEEQATARYRVRKARRVRRSAAGERHDHDRVPVRVVRPQVGADANAGIGSSDGVNGNRRREAWVDLVRINRVI